MLKEKKISVLLYTGKEHKYRVKMKVSFREKGFKTLIIICTYIFKERRLLLLRIPSYL